MPKVKLKINYFHKTILNNNLKNYYQNFKFRNATNVTIFYSCVGDRLFLMVYNNYNTDIHIVWTKDLNWKYTEHFTYVKTTCTRV